MWEDHIKTQDFYSALRMDVLHSICSCKHVQSMDVLPSFLVDSNIKQRIIFPTVNYCLKLSVTTLAPSPHYTFYMYLSHFARDQTVRDTYFSTRLWQSHASSSRMLVLLFLRNPSYKIKLKTRALTEFSVSNFRAVSK
jgi:hypothetical protein